MAMYTVKFYEGDYIDRQQAANKDKAVAYVEHHFNSAATTQANYAVVVVGSNAGATSKNWGRWYSEAIAKEFGVNVGGQAGLLVGGYNGRGDGNVRHTSMPAILLEPLFGSTPQHAEWIRSDAGQDRLARVLAESIQRFFPNGGLIAFSVGHKYRKSKPLDRGAPVLGGGNMAEADYAELVMKKAEKLLEKIDEPQIEREIRIVINDKVVHTQKIDDEADVTWDATRGILKIVEP